MIEIQIIVRQRPSGVSVDVKGASASPTPVEKALAAAIRAVCETALIKIVELVEQPDAKFGPEDPALN